MVDTEEITLKIEALPNQEVRFSEKDAVPDSIRGYLCYKDGKWNFEEIMTNRYKGRKYSEKLIKANDFIIALSLESPHKYEFDSNGKPLLPAQGKTGKKIDKIVSIAKKLVLDPCHRYVLILTNPVQYQTSCYNQLKDEKEYKNKKSKIRDEVFFKLFLDKNLKTDFEERLLKYEKKNLKIVINCCTKNLKKDVKNVIKESFSNTNIKPKYYEVHHPSYRYFKWENITSESFFE